MPFLNQRKGENDRRKYFMINLHERMLPTSAGVEPATFWSPVGRRIQLSHRGRLNDVAQIISLKGLDILSGDAVLSTLFLLPSEMGPTLKGKNLLPMGADSFLLE